MLKKTTHHRHRSHYPVSARRHQHSPRGESWFIHFEYNRPGFPPDPYGFTLEQRTPLGLAGLYSVVPEGRGMIELEQAQLPNGEPAFQAREIKQCSTCAS